MIGRWRPNLLGRPQGAEAAQAPTAADLEAMADQAENVIAQGEPEQAKALLRLLIAELRVKGKTDIQPIYRVVAPGVCATSEKVDTRGRRSNRTARVEALRKALADGR